MVPSGNMGVFDPTEIHNRGQLKSHMKEAMIKLGFHLLCFFMYLYRLVLKIASKEQRKCLPAIFTSPVLLVLVFIILIFFCIIYYFFSNIF